MLTTEYPVLTFVPVNSGLFIVQLLLGGGGGRRWREPVSLPPPQSWHRLAQVRTDQSRVRDAEKVFEYESLAGSAP